MLTVPHCAHPPALEAGFDQRPWASAGVATVARTWNGDPAPPALTTTARLLWTASDLWIAFECGYAELDIDLAPDPGVECHGLWERDVCEAFIQSPRESSADAYKEFQVAPTGQWFDAAIRRPRVDVDWRWDAGLATAAAIDANARIWRAVMRVPWAAFGGAPRAGDVWRANLFRISRVDGIRQFLAYAPTGTPSPDFHVPAAFVPLTLTGGRA
jgi:alpha-galactosidase